MPISSSGTLSTNSTHVTGRSEKYMNSLINLNPAHRKEFEMLVITGIAIRLLTNHYTALAARQNKMVKNRDIEIKKK